MIPASGSATVIVDPTSDNIVEADETVVLMISPDASYTVGTATASAVITNDDQEVVLPVVNITVNPGSVTEDGSENLVYTFTRSGGEATPLTVNYSTSGTATENVDYTGTNSSVTIPASGTATVIVNPVSDTDVEADETVVLTVLPSDTYQLGTSAASGAILNDDVDPGQTGVTFVNGVVTVFDGDDIEFFQIRWCW